MVGHHVAQSARLLVEAPAALDPDGLGRGDLDVVDVGAVPQGLENPVAEAQGHDVLDRFAEEVVHPVDLALVEHGEDLPVQELRRGEIGAERLLDDDAAVAAAALAFAGQAGGGEALDDPAEESRRRGEVEHRVPAGAVAEFGQAVGELPVGRRILEVAGEVEQPLAQPTPGRGVEPVGREPAAPFSDEAPHRLGEARGSPPRNRGCGRRPERRSVRRAAWRAPSCRGRASATAWSGRPWRRRSPACRAAPGRRWSGRASRARRRPLHRPSPEAGRSTWPPNLKRIADSRRSPNVWSWRERKRTWSAADRTSAGTASSIAAWMAAGPPRPRSDSVSSSASAIAVRSSSQEETTLPRRQTSAMSARSKLVALAVGQPGLGPVLQDVEALGVGLHQAVLDAVVDHLDEMPGAAPAWM